MKPIYTLHSRQRERISLLDTSLKTAAWRLLPVESYPAIAVERALAWQESFIAALPVRPSFAVVALLSEEDGSEQLLRLRESLAIQSVAPSAVHLLVDGDDAFLKAVQVEFEKGGIACEIFALRESNSAGEVLADVVSRCGEDYVVFLNRGTILHPYALFLFAKRASAEAYDLLYGNAVRLSSDLRSIESFIRRAEVDRYTNLSMNPVGNSLVLGAAVAKRIAADPELRSVPAPIVPWFIAADVLSRSERIHHLPLATFVTIAADSGPDLSQAAELESVERFLKRYAAACQIPLESVRPVPGDEASSRPILRPAEGRIQVVIPFRDQAALTIQCVKSLELQDCARDLELTLVDNNSTPKERGAVEAALAASIFAQSSTIVTDTGYFNFARLNNKGAANASTPFILFLNNDVELSGSESVSELRRWCALSDVGAVGGELRYPDGTLQHSGISFAAVRPKNVTERSEFAHLLREVDGVTFAMALVKRAAYEKVGRLNELHCPNGFGDALFCHELRKNWFRVVLSPFAKGVHHESASRGRMPEELELLEMVEAGLPIPQLYDDLSARHQPAILGPRSFLEQPIFKLARGLTQSRGLLKVANGVASVVIGSRKFVRSTLSKR